MTTPNPVSSPTAGPAAGPNNAGSSSEGSNTALIQSWVQLAARVADEKKATDVVILNVGDLVGITDYFVICSASNRRLVLTVAEEVEQQVKSAGGPAPISVEGLGEATWVLIDFGSFVVHVFGQEAREFYDLERLWRDAPRLNWAAN
jgi:ribosome-associated protein